MNKLHWVCLVFVFHAANAFTVFADESPAADESIVVDGETSAGDVAFFEQQIKPILETKCYKCHGGDKHKGGLSLASQASLLKGGDSGPAVDLDDLDDTQLMRALRYEDLEMPPTGKLPPAQIELFAKWVAKGVPWTPGVAEGANELVQEERPYITDEARSYWAYQPVVSPELPAVHDTEWPITPSIRLSWPVLNRPSLLLLHPQANEPWCGGFITTC